MPQLQSVLVLSLWLPCLLLLKYKRSKHLKAASEWAIGVDFGGTQLKIGIVDVHKKQITNRATVPVAQSREPNDVIDQIVQAADSLLVQAQLTWKDVKAMGICCPGQVKEGVVSTVANLKDWKDVPLKDLLRERTKVENVAVLNDANAALLGEMWSGGAKGCKDVVMITLGTGVGGSVASEGRLLTGHSGMFGEVGHHIFEVNGRLSVSTGVRGIAEEYCSARALQKTYMEIAQIQEAPSVESIFKLALEDKNSKALESLHRTADYCGVLIVNACRVYDPERVVLGGGMASNPWFVDRCRVAAFGLQWTLAKPTFTVSPAIHGNWAGVIGASFSAISMKSSSDS